MIRQFTKLIFLCAMLQLASPAWGVDFESREKPTHQHDWWIDSSTGQEKTYDWTDGDGLQHTSKITDKATDVNQMYALLNAIYTDPTVPGQNYHDEYLTDGTPCEYQITPRFIDYEEHAHRILNFWGDSANPTAYQTINGVYCNINTRPDLFMSARGGGLDAPWTSTYEHPTNKYGWSANQRIYCPWIKDEQKGKIQNPVEGMTVLLVEINDSWDQSMWTRAADRDAVDPLPFMRKSLKSMQVITESLRVSDDDNPGYLFVAKEVSASRFYFLSKGRGRGAGFFSSPTYCAFEIISPRFTAINTENLRSGNVERVEHDCYSVFQQGAPAHYVELDGGSQAALLSNLSLWMPDRRFRGVKYDPATKKVSETYSQWTEYSAYLYNLGSDAAGTTDKYRPGMLLYKAFLNATARPTANKPGYYTITLDWQTYFDANKLKANVTQQFYVYIYDEDTQSWKNLCTVDAAGIGETTKLQEWSYEWPQSEESQSFTYYVTANPLEIALDGVTESASNISVNTNTASVSIPGTGELFINDTSDYRSRFALDKEYAQYNVYRNRPVLTLTEASVSTAEGNKYELYRTNTYTDDSDPDNPVTATNDVKVAEVKFDAFMISGSFNGWHDDSNPDSYDNPFMRWTTDGLLYFTATLSKSTEFKIISEKGLYCGAYSDGAFWVTDANRKSGIQLHEDEGQNLRLEFFTAADATVTIVFDPATYTLWVYNNEDAADADAIAAIEAKATNDIYRYTIDYVAATQNLGTGRAADGDILFSDDTSTDLQVTGTLNVESGVQFVDRFTASTATNDHPANYTYRLRIGGLNASNAYVVPVAKSSISARLAGFTQEQARDDLNRELREGRQLKIEFNVRMDRERELERYDVHRVYPPSTLAEDSELAYHQHVGKAERTNEDNLYLLGIDHASGKVTSNLGVYAYQDYFNGRTMMVYDDSDYCPDDDPRYVTEIFLGKRDYDGNHVQNTYGTNVVDKDVPQLEFTCERLERNDYSWVTDGVRLTGYRADLKLKPDLPSTINAVYYYRIWRVDEDGNEVLLNTIRADRSEDNQHWGDYEALESFWPGNSVTNKGSKNVSDVYVAEPLPPVETETVYDVNTGETYVVYYGGKRRVTYIARMYSTIDDYPTGHLMPRSEGILPGESEYNDYYVTEKKLEVVYDDQVITGLEDLMTGTMDSPVVSERYYNIMGMSADKPFDGLNIVLRTHADGRVTTVKRLYR